MTRNVPSPSDLEAQAQHRHTKPAGGSRDKQLLTVLAVIIVVAMLGGMGYRHWDQVTAFSKKHLQHDNKASGKGSDGRKVAPPLPLSPSTQEQQQQQQQPTVEQAPAAKGNQQEDIEYWNQRFIPTPGAVGGDGGGMIDSAVGVIKRRGMTIVPTASAIVTALHWVAPGLLQYVIGVGRSTANAAPGIIVAFGPLAASVLAILYILRYAAPRAVSLYQRGNTGFRGLSLGYKLCVIALTLLAVSSAVYVGYAFFPVARALIMPVWDFINPFHSKPIAP